uniref:Uncharacterized protein n=1 Tax=Rhizophora mucronata TaxID=61149 RepID=A0A2P2N7Y2_RHIMU
MKANSCCYFYTHGSTFFFCLFLASDITFSGSSPPRHI